MEDTETTKPGDLTQFIDQYVENRYCLELLRFWGAHPYARFNRLAVIHAFNESGHKPEFERALIHLMDKGIVEAHIENNTHLYSLTEDESIRTQVLALAKLEWHHWQLVLTKALPIPVEQDRQFGS